MSRTASTGSSVKCKQHPLPSYPVPCYVDSSQLCGIRTKAPRVGQIARRRVLLGKLATSRGESACIDGGRCQQIAKVVLKICCRDESQGIPFAIHIKIIEDQKVTVRQALNTSAPVLTYLNTQHYPLSGECSWTPFQTTRTEAEATVYAEPTRPEMALWAFTARVSRENSHEHDSFPSVGVLKENMMGHGSRLPPGLEGMLDAVTCGDECTFHCYVQVPRGGAAIYDARHAGYQYTNTPGLGLAELLWKRSPLIRHENNSSSLVCRLKNPLGSQFRT